MSRSVATQATLARADPFKRLIIGIDVGFYATSASFCLVKRGAKPKVEGVDPWPGTRQQFVASIVEYDDCGRAKLRTSPCCECDEEAHSHTQAPRRSVDCWALMRAIGATSATSTDSEIVDLDSVLTQLADFLSLVWQDVGAFLWSRFSEEHRALIDGTTKVELVLTHPGHWGKAQRGLLEHACGEAGIVEPGGRLRLTLVSRSDAALHFVAPQMRAGEQVIVVGAEDGCDVAAWRSTGEKYQQIADRTSTNHRRRQGTSTARSSDSTTVQADPSGSGTVSMPLRKRTPASVQKRQRRGRTNVEEDVTAPRRAYSVIEFFYAAASTAIAENVAEHVDALCQQGKSVAIFTTKEIGTLSPFHSTASTSDGRQRVRVVEPDSMSQKSLAEGAVQMAMRNIVIKDTRKSFFGMAFCESYDPDKPEHLARRDSKIRHPRTQAFILPGRFQLLATKDTEGDVECAPTTLNAFCSASPLESTVTLKILVCKAETCPWWLHDAPFEELLPIKLDLSEAAFPCRRCTATGLTYYRWQWTCELKWEGTEMKVVCKPGEGQGMFASSVSPIPARHARYWAAKVERQTTSIMSEGESKGKGTIQKQESMKKDKKKSKKERSTSSKGVRGRSLTSLK
ncbi:hypothetical protein IE81DRAFT_344144 [Ceraceosorus guamensis]|uniref:Uncharacterized protein n=1 Tax=Ceraceosorus guamensis TaxID=1522189 RepID=A0A316W874_9BASI|nr:hypothetical protein IE81DRAFT_344144 [Ceraceosorus guamensis]PWN46079.1 hypothetical protein IE81DRAFT_344144 [Ceraceosorus guamensis]